MSELSKKLSKSGGGVWESNPPQTLFIPRFRKARVTILADDMLSQAQESLFRLCKPFHQPDHVPANGTGLFQG
jgi:hypothetical protein